MDLGGERESIQQSIFHTLVCTRLLPTLDDSDHDPPRQVANGFFNLDRT